MALRLKTRFSTKGPKTLEQRATVISSNIWRIAQHAARHMEVEGLKLGGDRQVAQVIVEFIAFQVQIADRIVYGQLAEDDRRTLINALGRQLARNVQENLAEFIGPGEYAESFVGTLNARFAEYADCAYTEKGPSYNFVRILGEKVAEAMAATETKWVLEHVMEIEAPEVVKATRKLVGEVLGVKTGG